jgi:Membrane-associated lipoprotein involved in thiamine biosynthesis
MATVEIEGGAVATSGDYQRFFDLDGRRYCHIIDARSGQPVTNWQSISVLAPLCVVAGSCATIAMLLEGEAEAFLAREGVAYLAVDSAGVLHAPTAP